MAETLCDKLEALNVAAIKISQSKLLACKVEVRIIRLFPRYKKNILIFLLFFLPDFVRGLASGRFKSSLHAEDPCGALAANASHWTKRTCPSWLEGIMGQVWNLVRHFICTTPLKFNYYYYNYCYYNHSWNTASKWWWWTFDNKYYQRQKHTSRISVNMFCCIRIFGHEKNRIQWRSSPPLGLRGSARLFPSCCCVRVCLDNYSPVSQQRDRHKQMMCLLPSPLRMSEKKNHRSRIERIGSLARSKDWENITHFCWLMLINLLRTISLDFKKRANFEDLLAPDKN